MKRLLLIMLCLFLVGTASFAQSKKRKPPKNFNSKNKQDEKFLEKQFWMGLKAGTNFSKVHLTKEYSVISPVNNEETSKEYESFNKPGFQVALELTFYFKGISASLQPTYRTSTFTYANHYEWADAAVPTNSLTLDYYQEQKLEYFEVPLVVKYDILSGNLRPYIQLGGYGAFLINATKTVEVSGLDLASGGENSFTNEPVIVGAKDLFAKSNWGLIGGAGVNYNVGNIRINLDIMYRYGMSNISSTENRYSNDRLAGVGDAMDDMTMDNLSISLGALFPLRFLSSGFKSSDSK